MNINSRLVVAVSALSLAVSASAGEQRVKLKDLPEAVRKTVLEQSRGGKIVALDMDAENGKTVYEAEIAHGAARKDIEIDDAGAVIEAKETVKFAELPAAVKTGLVKAAGKGKIKEVEAVSKNGVVTAYEAEVRAGGKTSGVKVGPDGAPIVQAAGAKEAGEHEEDGDKD